LFGRISDTTCGAVAVENVADAILHDNTAVVARA
jgi:hypothetical protein